MKRTLALTLALTMALSRCACGADNGSQADTASQRSCSGLKINDTSPLSSVCCAGGIFAEHLAIRIDVCYNDDAVRNN